MASNVVTRTARVAQGKCGACLKRQASAGHSTCRQCRVGINAHTAQLYADRRAAGLCYRCGEPAAGYLCEPHAAERREARRVR